jgi:hypothetical protein
MMMEGKKDISELMVVFSAISLPFTLFGAVSPVYNTIPRQKEGGLGGLTV